MQGLNKINDSFELFHTFDCIRNIVKINDYKLSSQVSEFKQIGSSKVFGGHIK
jgi:hypothetical protein